MPELNLDPELGAVVSKRYNQTEPTNRYFSLLWANTNPWDEIDNIEQLAKQALWAGECVTYSIQLVSIWPDFRKAEAK